MNELYVKHFWVLFFCAAIAGCRGNHGDSSPLITFQAQKECTSQVQTTDDFQFKPDAHSYARIFASGPGGTLYVSGWAQEASNIVHSLLRRSDDDGVTWQTVGDRVGSASTALAVAPSGDIYLAYSDEVLFSVDKGKSWKSSTHFKSKYPNSRIVSMAVDSAGIPYFAVSSFDKKAGSGWHVLKGLDFAEVDRLADGQFIGATPVALAIDLIGRIFVVGSADDSSHLSHWVVRESSDGAANWATIDDFQVGVESSMASAVTIGKRGEIYVAGRSVDYSGNRWVLRKSSDGGAVWTTLDDFRSSIHRDAAARFILEMNGTPVAVGSSTSETTGAHWVSRSANGSTNSSGMRWKIIDDFQYSANQEAHAFGGGPGPSGEVFVVGEARDASGISHWIVRRQDPCI